MPTHVYHPTNNPPTLWDRLLVHPLDNTVALLAVMFGLTSGASLFAPDFIPSATMHELAWPVVALVSAFLLGGGVVGLIGLHWCGDTVSDGWALERLGWLLSFAGLLVYAISVGASYPSSLYAWGVPLGLALGCALRVWSVVKIERGTRQLIKEVRNP